MPGKILAGTIAGFSEGKYAPPLPDRNLGNDVGGCAEAVDAESFGAAGGD
ncbi:hypothetical protein [Methylomonas koyamae]|nr:hypothetical protein [Methylomonas koyamae]